MAWGCVAPLRVTGIHHTSVMHWVREAGHELTDVPESDEIPEITTLMSCKRLSATSGTKYRFGRLSIIGVQVLLPGLWAIAVLLRSNYCSLSSSAGKAFGMSVMATQFIPCSLKMIPI
jgi:hypothetical protein